jgi:hypothetical protein
MGTKNAPSYAIYIMPLGIYITMLKYPAHVDSLSAIIANYSKFCESLIKNEGKISGDTKSKASAHRRMLEDLEFLIVLCFLNNFSVIFLT